METAVQAKCMWIESNSDVETWHYDRLHIIPGMESQKYVCLQMLVNLRASSSFPFLSSVDGGAMLHTSSAVGANANGTPLSR